MNLWILTEERPKLEIVEILIRKFLSDFKSCAFIDNLRILPMIRDCKFSFTYEIIGIRSEQIQKIFLEIVSGSGSFVDYLVFFQEHNVPSDTPLYIIEETKTDDSESRNTGVYQRIAKFIKVNLIVCLFINLIFRSV